MGDQDRAYFSRRAEEEIARAQGSGDPAVVRFHYLLADLFLQRLYPQAEDSREAPSHG